MSVTTVIRWIAVLGAVMVLSALSSTLAFAVGPQHGVLRIDGLGISVCGEAASCPDLQISIQQVDAAGDPTDAPVPAGETARFEVLVWNTGAVDALDVQLDATSLPGVSWSMDAPAIRSCTSSGVPGAPPTVTCDLGTVPPGSAETAISILLTGTPTVPACGPLEVSTVVRASNQPEPTGTSATISVQCPPATLVLDKTADASSIAITGPSDALVVTPSVVTWTMTYTLTGPGATNVTITDVLPAGLAFLDASDGGRLVDGAVTWTLPSITTSGSVTLRTTIDPQTISRVAPTVNAAMIESDQTGVDDGTASLSVTVEGPPLGGNPPVAPPGGASTPIGPSAPVGSVQSSTVPNTAIDVPTTGVGTQNPSTWLGSVAVAMAVAGTVRRLSLPRRRSP